MIFTVCKDIKQRMINMMTMVIISILSEPYSVADTLQITSFNLYNNQSRGVIISAFHSKRNRRTLSYN